MNPVPNFTADVVNFEQELWECYRRFIERLRRQVAVRFSNNLAVTPLEENPPTRFFDVLLATNTHTIRVRFRRDNLYLVGYQMRNHVNEPWLELSHNHDDGIRQIANSTPLQIGDTYANLRAAAGVQNTSQMIGGRQQFIDAITYLATTTDRLTRGRSLLLLAVMISEAIRFPSIANFFGDRGRSYTNIPDWVQDYVLGWGDLSEALLHTNVDNVFQLPELTNFGDETPRTVEEAVRILGAIKGYNFGPGGHRGKRQVGEHSNANYIAGRPLVELFSVKINNINGNQFIIGDIYGTIQVHDGLGKEYMYNRRANASESIHAGETILLNGPARCISAYGGFAINVTIMSKEGLSEDDQISEGQILWEVPNMDTRSFDKLLSQQVRGRFGLATLNYAILSNAVEATIQVTLVRKSGSDSVDVYGLLTSPNVSLNSESVLFRKNHNKFINVKPGRIIPLSRSVVAVPLNSNFVVRADLKGSNIFSSNDEIAKGIAKFSPQISGTQEQSIYSSNNSSHIQVKVIWAWNV